MASGKEPEDAPAERASLDSCVRAEDLEVVALPKELLVPVQVQVWQDAAAATAHGFTEEMSLTVWQDFRGSDGTGIGGTLWSSGRVLLAYFQDPRTFPPKHFAHKRVLELGAGTGAVALLLSLLGCQEVIATDLPRVLPLCELNIESNWTCEWGTTRPTVQPLVWGADCDASQFGELDVIVAADVVYDPAAFEPLAATLRALAGAKTSIYIAYEARHDDEMSFFDMLSPDFVVTELDLEDTLSTAATADLLAPDSLCIFQLNRKQAAESTGSSS